MRIIAGELRGRRLVAVPGRGTRPTSDRVREALFSRLQSRYGLEGIEVLDLFAGTGALGLEAISRGARALVSVEIDRRAAQVLLSNLRACGADGRAEVLVRDVERSVAELAGRRFGGIFLDPPYGLGMAAFVLGLLAEHELVAPGGWVSVETAAREDLPQSVGDLVEVREDFYGDTKITIYERRAVAA
jgi:16S rRNA (guanine(966)-N(2))-methyltransferase RsmD